MGLRIKLLKIKYWCSKHVYK